MSYEMSEIPSIFFYTITQITYRIFLVHKESAEDSEDYYVRLDERGWRCSCLGNLHSRNCKHIIMVKEHILSSISNNLISTCRDSHSVPGEIIVRNEEAS